jgi:Holliday junction resolvase RusA-like endonuclease
MIYQLTGKITPKARPRLGNGRAYLPANYRDWKEDAILQLLTQSRLLEPMTRAEVAIAIGGKQTGDLDNIAGAILDALVQAGVLLDDRISVVHKLSISHHRENTPGATIELTDPTEELTAITDPNEIAVNYQPNQRPRQRDYIGCISPKQIKGITYHYWVYYERGKRCYQCLGNDRASAVAKAKAIYDPRSA